ncbi:hypothetical protein GCM10022215_17820 [Nocardioides fonticola]|uniref:Uncharacterized protein n=1 Tax=Nocardioides fonticola TaxID=450363 RepID=A0ABP7XHS3_9ACTN
MTTERLTPAGHPTPIGWDDWSSSARDLYDDRMTRDAERRAARTANTAPKE